MDEVDHLFNFFYLEAKENPWNLYPNFPEHISSDLIGRIKLEWPSIPQDSKLGFLIATLTPYKRKVTPAYKDCVLQLLEIALGDGSQDVLLMANCIKHWIEHGYLDLSIYKECDEYKSIQGQMDDMMKDIKWIPREVEYLSEKVLESYRLPDMDKEGLIFKEGHSIPSLKERMKKYGVDRIQEPILSPSVGDREKKSSASFLRRASRGSTTSPSSSFPKARHSSVKDSKAVVLDMKELESLQMEQAKEKKKIEDEKLKKQRDKEEAKEAKRQEKFRLEEEKRRHDQLKKEQDKIRKEKAEEEKKVLLQKKKDMAAQKRQEGGDKPKRKGSNGTESDAKKSKITPSQSVLNVIGNADLCTADDVVVIEDFLQGRYKIHSELKQICLTERIFEDEQGISKKEAIILILDYSQCKWRKIRKTVSNLSAYQMTTSAETETSSNTETPPVAVALSTTEIPPAVELPNVTET